jgi:hypothetical protein
LSPDYQKLGMAGALHIVGPCSILIVLSDKFCYPALPIIERGPDGRGRRFKAHHPNHQLNTGNSDFPLPSWLRLDFMVLRSFLLLLFCGSFANAAFANDWGCYDPKPGHPTAAERVAFIHDVSELAVAAEKKHGVPASALAAMAMVESGYGWTRTALDAHNFFGWKFTSPQAAGQRGSYVLDCQPPEDINNRYIVFSDAADAVDFIAAKLATLPAYWEATKAYKFARAKGEATVPAVKSWLAGIADPYNWKPAEYVMAVTRVMSDPISPSDAVSPDHSLYALSQGVTSASANASQDLAQAAAYYAAHLEKRNCFPPDTNFPRWSGFPVQNCPYEDVGISVHTYMLNPTADQLARWTVTACHDAGAASPGNCITYMEKLIMDASSGVFPVAGYIPEPAASGGGHGSAAQCYLFRDGVTIATDTWDSRAPTGKTCGPSDENDKPARRAKKYARVASTTRQEYRQTGGTEQFGTDQNGDVRWLDVVRQLYQQAWTSDRNQLISAKPKAAKAKGDFK